MIGKRGFKPKTLHRTVNFAPAIDDVRTRQTNGIKVKPVQVNCIQMFKKWVVTVII